MPFFPDLNRPPFRVIPRQSAESAAADIANAFACLEKMADHPASQTLLTLTTLADFPSDWPTVTAARNLAPAVGDQPPHPYHNARHAAEVMLGAYFLAQLTHLPQAATAELLLAALLHDYAHDGQSNGDTAFRLERKTLSAIAPQLEKYGLPESQRRRLFAYILATEVQYGHKVARACHALHAQGKVPPEIPPTAPELAELLRNPLAAQLAVTLGEADLLASVGLSVEQALQQQQRLAEEWDTPLTPGDLLNFIESQFGDFTIGKFFTPNLQRLRRSLSVNAAASPLHQPAADHL